MLESKVKQVYWRCKCPECLNNIIRVTWAVIACTKHTNSNSNNIISSHVLFCRVYNHQEVYTKTVHEPKRPRPKRPFFLYVQKPKRPMERSKTAYCKVEHGGVTATD